MIASTGCAHDDVETADATDPLPQAPTTVVTQRTSPGTTDPRSDPADAATTAVISRDPHGDPRNDVEVRRQKAAFLFNGELIEVCNDGPCTATPR